MSSDYAGPPGFELIRELGRGGTARVYLARRQNDSREYALKIPLDENPEDSPRFQALLKREYELIGRLGYPGIVRLYEILDDEKSPLLMEYCAHRPLSERRGSLSNRELANLISSVSINLYYLSLLGISHGDLKPDNLFAPFDDFANRKSFAPLVKISDFSLGLLREEESSRRQGLGTVGYIAPETIEHNMLDHRSDLFALGIIAYELATGEHPFYDEENDPVRINARTKESDPAPPSQKNPALSGELSDCIMQLLEKEPRNRPSDGWEVCVRLEKAGAGFDFKNAIRPKHLMSLISPEPQKSELESGPFRFDKKNIDELLIFAEGDRENLRRLLELNFSKNRFVWIDGTLKEAATSQNIIWPTRFKRALSRRFGSMNIEDKRKTIKASVIGNVNDAIRAGIISGKDTAGITEALLRCCSTRLSDFTLRNQAEAIAEKINKDDKERSDIAAKLWMKAENIEKAYHSSLQATRVSLDKSNIEDAVSLLENLIELCDRKNDNKTFCLSLMELGDIQKLSGEASKAEQSYHRILKAYTNKKPDKLLAETHKDLGDVYKMKQDFATGISHLEKAITIYRELDDRLEVSHTLNNMGNLLTLNAEHKKAFAHYREALKIQRRLNSMKDAASTLNNMASYYVGKGRFYRVERIFRLALRINREIGEVAESARVLNNLGYVYHELGQFDKAIDSLQESLKLNRQAGLKKEILFNLNNLTEAMLSAGRLKEALQPLKEGIDLGNELNDVPNKAFMLNIMAAVLKRMGYYGQAHNKLIDALKYGEEIDDQFHFISCNIRLADLYIKFNDNRSAREKLDMVIAEAEEAEDKRIVMQGNLLLGILNDSGDDLMKALKLSEELILNRESSLIKSRLIKYHLDHDNTDFPKIWIDQVYKFFQEKTLDIEKAECFNTIGRTYHYSGNLEKAEHHFLKALKAAKESALMPEEIESSRYLGKIAGQRNEFEEAFKYYRMAMEKLKKMAGDITEESWVKGFLSNRDFTEMSRELAELKNKLSVQRKAGPA